MKRLFLSFFLIGILCYGQDGSPDLSFGDNGVVYEHVGIGGIQTQYERASLFGAAENSAWELVTMGWHKNSWYSNEYNFFARFTPDGQLDPSFGSDGFVLLPMENDVEFKGLHLQNDDKMVVVTIVEGAWDYGLKRFLANGTLDESFGNNGTVSLFTNTSIRKKWVFTENDNSFFMVQEEVAGEDHLIIKKTTSEGLPDSSFGTDGQVDFVAPNIGNYTVRDAITTPEEELLIYLRQNESPEVFHYVIKFGADGTLDTNYGLDGIAQIPVSTDFIFCNLLPYGSNATLCSCYGNVTPNEQVGKIVLLSETGQAVSDFGVNGSIDGPQAVLVQNDQRIITDTPEFDWEGGYTPHLNRFHSDGQEDTSFDYFSNYPYTLGNTFYRLLHSGKFLMVTQPAWYNGSSSIILQRFNNSPLGIEEAQVASVSIAPNPSRGRFQINLTQNWTGPTFYQISDVTGKKVHQGRIDEAETTLDLSAFQNGLYFLRLQNKTYKLLKN